MNWQIAKSIFSFQTTFKVCKDMFFGILFTLLGTVSHTKCLRIIVNLTFLNWYCVIDANFRESWEKRWIPHYSQAFIPLMFQFLNIQVFIWYFGFRRISYIQWFCVLWFLLPIIVWQITIFSRAVFTNSHNFFFFLLHSFQFALYPYWFFESIPRLLLLLFLYLGLFWHW